MFCLADAKSLGKCQHHSDLLAWGYTDGLGNCDIQIVRAIDLFVDWGRHANAHAGRRRRYCHRRRLVVCVDRR